MRSKYKRVQAVECPQCFRVLVSLSVHDFNLCGCSNRTMVDGGFDYDRYGGVKMPRRITNLYWKVDA